MKRLILIAIILSMSFPAVVLSNISGTARVIDGDTISILNERIRLHGIDTPESSQTCIRESVRWDCGFEATKILESLIKNSNVSCIERDRDRYGRIIADCKANGVNLSAAMVDSGMALAYRQFSKDYVSNETTAKMAKRGLWSGQFISPWEWRKGKRLPPINQIINSSKDCKIKGNIGSKGARIYHIPGTRWYSKTKITIYRGERWFCTENEARSAGWRRADHANELD